MYRVDTLPWFWRPFVWFYGMAVAVLLYAYTRLVHSTSRIRLSGQAPVGEENYILCHWHAFILVYLCVFLRHRKHAWMQHPFWFMKPVHLLLRLVGVRKIVLGSSGHGGVKAADELVEFLKQGFSTVMFPDGPAGPSMIARKGVLHISRQSGVPIIPVRFHVERCLRLRTWDRKRLPLPFGSIKVEFGKPMAPGDDIETAWRLLSEELGMTVDRPDLTNVPSNS